MSIKKFVGLILFEIILKKSFEKHDSLTNYHVSVAKKLGLSLFLNTALVTFLVNMVVNGKYFYGEGNFK